MLLHERIASVGETRRTGALGGEPVIGRSFDLATLRESAVDRRRRRSMRSKS
jgi:hypothetical protein